MTQRANVAVIILIVLIIISLSLAGGMFYLFNAERQKSMSLQQELEKTLAGKKSVESKLKDTQTRVDILEKGVKDAEKQIESLNKDLKQEIAAKKEAQGQADILKSDLEKQKALYADLNRKLTDAKTESQRMQAQVTELNTKKGDLESKVKELQSKSQELEEALGHVQLGNIVVTPEAVPSASSAAPAAAKQTVSPPAGGREGKTLVVNREYNFVVINLGSKDGVAVGDVFSVYHGNKYAGDVKVEQIHDAMSAAGFLSGDIKGKVTEGDKVVQKVK